MSAPTFGRVTAAMMPLPIDHVDTDQIIPAEFLKTTERQGIGRGLFAGWRRLPSGEPDPAFVLNDPRYAQAKILVAGENFGCGSSREHAPWALIDHGFRAVVSSGFADIFRSNALKNGLLPVEISAAERDALMITAQDQPTAQITIDLGTNTLIDPQGREITFQVDPFSRRCLLDGVDTLGYLLSHLPAIESWEREHPNSFDTRTALPGTALQGTETR